MLIPRRDIMVRSGNSLRSSENRDILGSQAIESLRTRNFVDKMPVNIQYGGAAFNGINHMIFPNFIEKGFPHGTRVMN
jgi:hypothetical protein